jgi:FAD/FMN-containing dehydrogenase
LYSLRSIDYDRISQTVEIGTGLKWDDVYAALEPHNVSVAGGRLTNVGVGGFTLGGGTIVNISLPDLAEILLSFNRL